MYKKLAYAGAVIATGALAVVVGCGGGGGGTHTTYDFATAAGDAGNKGDGSTTNKDASAMSYTATTPNEVDTDTIGGNFANGAAVSMTGLIVLAPPTGFSAKVTTSGDGCRYEVWAQDPACTTPPCGIIVETQAILNPNAGTSNTFCPFAADLDDSKNVLKNVWVGDKIDIKGVVDNFSHTGSATDGGASATINAHQIELDSLTTTATKQTLPTPIAVTDTTPSHFVPYTGDGWKMYEGTLIKLSPATGKFTTTLNTSSSFADTCAGVTGKTNGSFAVSPGGANFADTYASFYKADGGVTNCWPINGSMYSSITAIVSASFGGDLLPTTSSDFHP